MNSGAATSASAAQAAQAPFTAKDARGARVSYQHVSGVVNRLLNCLMQPLSDGQARAFKSSVFQTVHSLHGFLNGQEASPAKPLFRSHQFVAPYFNYKGRPEHSGTFMGRKLDDLRAAELACGREFFRIRRADGREQEMTSYEGTPLLDAAEWVYMRARNSPDYWKNPRAAVTDDLLDEGIARLPAVEPRPGDAKLLAGKKPPAEMTADDLMTDSVLKAQRTNLLKKCRAYMKREMRAGKNPRLVADELEQDIEKIARDLHAAMSAEIERKRREWARAGAEGEVEADADDSVLSGNNSARQVEAGAAPREADFGGLPPHKNVGESDRQVAENSAVAESPGRETEISILDAALWWAARGVPVFPLYSVFDGICFCPEGSECKSAGKHPLTRRGLKEATTDATQIRRWWGSHPHANVGGRTGGALCLVVVDVDPKSGGDASLCDLSDAHGMDWLDTFSAETGSRGTHLFFTYSEGVELRNTAGKLAPGIDTRAEGGYVVLAPSLHASGRRYWLSNKTDIAAAPAWLVESLTRKPGDLPPVAIDFQERRARRGGGPVIGEGERNERLFRIGCGIWGKGEAKDRGDLYSQLLAVNVERVSPPLTPSEVVKIVDSITARYARGAPIKEAGT